MTIEQIQEVSELVYRANKGNAYVFFTQIKHSCWVSVHQTISGSKISHGGHGCVQFDDYTTMVKVLTKMIQKMEVQNDQ